MSGSAHLEPYSGADLANWLLARGARMVPTKGGGLHTIEVRPGKFVKVSPKAALPTRVAKIAAGVLGMSYQEMRASLGHPVVASGRPKRRPTGKVQGRSKSDVLACSRDAHRALTQIEQAVKPGLRDSAFYGRVHETLTEAKRLIDLALAEATSNGTRRSA